MKQEVIPFPGRMMKHLLVSLLDEAEKLQQVNNIEKLSYSVELHKKREYMFTGKLGRGNHVFVSKAAALFNLKAATTVLHVVETALTSKVVRIANPEESSTLTEVSNGLKDEFNASRIRSSKTSTFMRRFLAFNQRCQVTGGDFVSLRWNSSPSR